MPDFSDYAENRLLDHILGTAAWPMPTPWLSLHSGHPAETGANELAGGSYARQAGAFGAAVGGSASSTAAEEWDLTGVASGTVFFAGLWDAAVAGNFLWAVPLNSVAAGPLRATFTALASTEVLTSYGHGLVDNDRVYVKQAGGSALPGGLATDTLYHVVGATADTFQVSLTQGGAAVDLTSDGEGVAVRANGRPFTDGDTFRVPAGQLDFSVD